MYELLQYCNSGGPCGAGRAFETFLGTFNPFRARQFALLVLVSSKKSLAKRLNRSETFLLRTLLSSSVYESRNSNRTEHDVFPDK